METTKELSALFTLIDDPDEEVFGAVSEKIIDYGKNIIPSLEHLWETIPDENVQHRIELLIHRLHYRDLSEDFRQWNVSGHHDLMLGALLVSKFQYPDLATAPVLQEIEKIRRNIWLELNNYLTPLEQIHCANDEDDAGEDVRQIGEIAEEVDHIEVMLNVRDELRDNGRQRQQAEEEPTADEDVAFRHESPTLFLSIMPLVRSLIVEW